MGAKLILTRETTEKVCEMLRKGELPRFACIEAGISERSYFRWRAEGKEILQKRDEGDRPEDADKDAKMHFFIETEKALGVYDKKLGEELERLLTWQAICWIRQRRFPSDYGNIALSSLSSDELRELAEMKRLEERKKIHTRDALSTHEEADQIANKLLREKGLLP